MDALLRAFCHWLQNQQFALYISGSTWAFPYAQLIHYTGMGMWVGTSIILDFRILGLVKPVQTVGKFARSILALNWIALGVGLIGAVLLFSCNAESYYTNPAFRIKFPLVLIGILLHGFIQGKALKAKTEFTMPAGFKMAAFAELAIWMGVVLAATRIPNQ